MRFHDAFLSLGEDELKRMWRRFTEGVLKRDSNEETPKENCSTPKTSPKMPPKMETKTGMDFEEYRQRGKSIIVYLFIIVFTLPSQHR